MEKEWNNEHGMNRRRFLRQAVLAGSTFCVASTTGKAVGSEPAVMNISGRPYTGLAGMAAVHNRRTLVVALLHERFGDGIRLHGIEPSSQSASR